MNLGNFNLLTILQTHILADYLICTTYHQLNCGKYIITKDLLLTKPI